MKSVKATEETDATIHEDSNPSGPSSLGKRSRRKVSNGESYWKERHSKLGFGKIKWTVLLVILIVCCSYLYVHWRDWQQSSDHQGSLLDFLLTDLPVSLFSSSGADKTNQYAIAGERSYDRVADTLKAEVGQYLEKEVEPEGWQTWENGINTLIERVREHGDTDSVRRLTEKREKERNRITQLAQLKAEVGQYLEKKVEPKGWQTWENGINTLIERVREQGDTDSVRRLTEKREKEQNRITQLAQLKAEVGQYLEMEVEPEGWQTWENGIDTLIERVREQGDIDSILRLTEKREKERNRIMQLEQLKAEVGQYLEKEVEPEGWQTWENGINTLIERVREQGDTDSVRRLSEKRTEEQNRITQLAQKKLDHYWALYLKTQNQDDLDEYEHWRLFLNDVKGGALIAAPDPNLPDLHLLDTIVKQGDFDASKEGLKEYLLKKIDSVETYLLQSKAVGGATRQTLQQTVTMARKLIRENTYTVTVELTGGWNHAFDVYIWGIWFSTQGNGARDEDNDKVQEWSDRANRFTLSHSTKWAAGQPLRLSVYRNDYLMLKQRIGSFYYDDPLAIKHFCKRSNAHFTRDTVENRKMDFHSTDDFYAMEYRLSISCDGQEWGDEELALIQNVETYLISSEYWRKLLQQACERRMPQGLGDPRLGDEAGIGKACP